VSRSSPPADGRGGRTGCRDTPADVRAEVHGDFRGDSCGDSCEDIVAALMVRSFSAGVEQVFDERLYDMYHVRRDTSRHGRTGV
jgi:hypothetical protein